MPVGTILPYIGNLDDIPYGWALYDGTNGTPDLRGRFLEGTIDSPKSFKEAGLPNITGWIGLAKVDYWGRSGGAFYTIYQGAADNAGYIDGNFNTNNQIGFDASRSNSIYGASNTLQPKSYTVYYIMRLI